jgi:hypothetical protein
VPSAGPLGLFPGQPGPRLYDRVVEVLRGRHYRRRTEEAYVQWIRRFLRFHAGRHPRDLAEGDVSGFLTHLAVRENVAASTQNQALASLLFLYEHVLEQPPDRIEGVVRAHRPRRLPVVLSREEAALYEPLQEHLRWVRCQHETDLHFGRRSGLRLTLFAILSPGNSWRRVTTSARSRSCWDTRTCEPP